MPPSADSAFAKFGLFEIAFHSDEQLPNPFWDARTRAQFISPCGKPITVDGFYYGQREWRVRFVPREHGQWQGDTGAVTTLKVNRM